MAISQFHEIPWNPSDVWKGALLVPWNSMEPADIDFATQDFQEIYGIFDRSRRESVIK